MTIEGTVIRFSEAAPGKVSPNEDSVAVIETADEGLVLVVADGVGGQPAGEAASRTAVEAVAASVGELDGRSLERAIREGIEDANTTILQWGTGAATTIAVVEIEGGVARPYHVGDSTILVTGQRGRRKLLTVPHSLDGEPGVVTNVVGDVDMRIESGPPVALSRRDTVVVASDGLFDNLSVDEIVEHVRSGPLEAAGDALAAAARSRMLGEDPDHPGHPDDLSFLLYRRGARRGSAQR